jgi:hypothetical protein
MRTIRKSIFETNSSSTHSLSLEMGLEWDTITPEADGVIRFYGMDFGWEWQAYNDAYTKAEYCLADGIDREKIREIVEDFTGCPVEFMFNEDDWDVSHIDHESVGTARRSLHSTNDLRNFIFNKSSMLFTGNDNGEPPANFYDPPGTVYKWELHFDDMMFKFVEGPSKVGILEIISENLYHPKTFAEVDFEKSQYSYYNYDAAWNSVDRSLPHQEKVLQLKQYVENKNNWQSASFKLIENETVKQIS